MKRGTLKRGMLKSKALLAFAAALAALAVVTILLVDATSTVNPGNTVNPGTAVPPLYLGSDSYAHWDKLSYLEIGDRIGSQTICRPGWKQPYRRPARYAPG